MPSQATFPDQEMDMTPRRTKRRFAVAAVLATFTLAGFAAWADDGAGDEVSVKQAQVDLAGFESEAPHFWKKIGTGKVVDGEPERDFFELLERAALEGRKGAKDRPAKRLTRWVAFDVETGTEYLVELPVGYLRRIGEAAVAAGVNEPYQNGQGPAGEPVQASAGLIETKGWSNGEDTRTRRFDNTTFPYSAMGQVNGGEKSGCSGTLIGPRHVLTAAHCVWSRKEYTWYPFTFRPGREGACDSASCQPFGAHGAIWYFTPEAYRTYSDSQAKPYDYAIVTTQNRPGELTGGWMGYVAVGKSVLKSHCNDGKHCFNRGYPACGLEGAPADCEQGWAYQDVDYCQVSRFRNKDADDWHQRFKVDCDISKGHSGSALFSNDWDGDDSVVFGVASRQSCATCGPRQRWVNTFRRITPEVLDWISYFKTVQFP